MATQALTVSICAWNVDQQPPPKDLREWLGLDNSPDIVAVGLQEVDMSATALMREVTDKRLPWIEGLSAALPGYLSLGWRQMVGLMLAVFVTQDLAASVGRVALRIVKCGQGGKLGNKGAVGLTVAVRRTRLCFVTAHLAAHMQHTGKRNADFLRIMDCLEFDLGEGDRIRGSEHDAIFFFGDLNYRIELPMPECVRLVEQKQWEALLARDQLRAVYASPVNPYQGFADALAEVPTFAPTYKYVPGAHHYDTAEGGKQRTPAWCDRLLWWTRTGEACPDDPAAATAGSARLRYFRRIEYLTSDHRPVAGQFTVWVPAPRKRQTTTLGGATMRIASVADPVDDFFGQALKSDVFEMDQSAVCVPDLDPAVIAAIAEQGPDASSSSGSDVEDGLCCTRTWSQCPYVAPTDAAAATNALSTPAPGALGAPSERAPPPAVTGSARSPSRRPSAASRATGSCAPTVRTAAASAAQAAHPAGAPSAHRERSAASARPPVAPSAPAASRQPSAIPAASSPAAAPLPAPARRRPPGLRASAVAGAVAAAAAAAVLPPPSPPPRRPQGGAGQLAALRRLLDMHAQGLLSDAELARAQGLVYGVY
eukprot:TRINITY_DN6017_c0_g1_i1.p1 TRINITY_DN6017_c0_g1~~TRINITY_DN6017_c0_g1_i1.p1  ORF type:complete len:595 (+),score=143.41 TRINITY_DN6017_c0_g1_i1:82-1866(+)